MTSLLTHRRVSRLLSPIRKTRSLRRLQSSVLEVRSLDYLKKALRWTNDPDLDFEHIHTYDYFEDLNDRRLRDAEVIGAACANGDPKILLEIGTSRGHSSALMARNAPQATLHTVNIPPEEIDAGGKHVTWALSREEIGQFYREQGLTNIQQIYANTATWSPNFGPIDVAFIDGCHDADFVYHDTRKVLACCQPGSLILWHDLNLELVGKYSWMAEVARGIERLLAEKIIRGRILHLQDSWIGLYQVPTA